MGRPRTLHRVSTCVTATLRRGREAGRRYEFVFLRWRLDRDDRAGIERNCDVTRWALACIERPYATLFAELKRYVRDEYLEQRLTQTPRAALEHTAELPDERRSTDMTVSAPLNEDVALIESIPMSTGQRGPRRSLAMHVHSHPASKPLRANGLFFL